MAVPNRRYYQNGDTRLDVFQRAAIQTIRDGGDGPAGGGGTWGSISGAISDQEDLNQILNDNQLLHFFFN